MCVSVYVCVYLRKNSTPCTRKIDENIVGQRNLVINVNLSFNVIDTFITK